MDYIEDYIKDTSYYIKLPHQLFYSLKEQVSMFKSIQIKGTNKSGEDTYHNTYYIILVLDYLYTNTNRQGNAMFTINDIVKFCKLSKKQKPVIKGILLQLKKLTILSDDISYIDLKPNIIVYSKLKLFTLNEQLKDTWFSMLHYSAKDKILAYSVENIDNVALLFYYGYLNSRVYRRAVGDDFTCHGGKPEVCYPSYHLIHDDLGFASDTIIKYNKILVELKLIVIGNAGLYYIDGDKDRVTRESNNVYAVVENSDVATADMYVKEEIKMWKALDINKNRIFKGNRDYTNNNHKLNGELGSLVKKEIAEGKGKYIVTPEETKRKNEIILKLSEGSEYVFKIQSLLLHKTDDGENMLLSEIYADFFNDKLSEKFEQLELDLGLIDEDGVLLVSWDYYSWIMINYKENGREMSINCVKKEIRENNAPKHRGLRGNINE